MQTSSVFDRLVQELSQEERQEMLGKLTRILESESEPVHSFEDDPKPVNLESEYTNFSFFQKLIVLLRTVFSPLTRMEVIEDTIMRRIFHNLEDRYPGLYDFSRGTLGRAFLDEIKTLRKAVQVFMVPLSRLTQQRKEELFALILNRELPQIDARIREQCNPSDFASGLEDTGEKELFKLVYARFEDIVDELTPEERAILMQDAQMLQILSELVYFPYDKISTKFAAGKEEGTPASELKEQLNQLTRIFHSMNHPASAGLIESLFIIVHLDQEELDSREILEKLKGELNQARESLMALRGFYRGVPLYDILRLASGKANVFLKPVSRGEEWLALLRNFWKRKLKGDVRRFLLSHEYEKAIGEARELLGKKELKPLPYYRHSVHPVPVELAHIASVSFLSQFIEHLFSLKMNLVLKQVLIDGEFYKAQNSEDYSEAYNGLHLLGEKIQEVSAFLSPSGDGGRRLDSISTEISTPLIREKKVSKVAADADAIARRYVGEGIELITLLAAVLQGILHGEKGGRYDTLSNLGYIGGRNNENFLKELAACSQVVDEGERILSALVDLEERYAQSA